MLFYIYVILLTIIYNLLSLHGCYVTKKFNSKPFGKFGKEILLMTKVTLDSNLEKIPLNNYFNNGSNSQPKNLPCVYNLFIDYNNEILNINMTNINTKSNGIITGNNITFQIFTRNHNCVPERLIDRVKKIQSSFFKPFISNNKNKVYGFDNIYTNQSLFTFKYINENKYNILPVREDITGCNKLYYKTPNLSKYKYAVKYVELNSNKSVCSTNLLIPHNLEILPYYIHPLDYKNENIIYMMEYYQTKNLIKVGNYIVAFYLLNNEDVNKLVAKGIANPNYNFLHFKYFLHQFQEFYSFASNLKNYSINNAYNIKHIDNILKSELSNQDVTKCLSALSFQISSITDIVEISYYKIYRNYLYLCIKEFYIKREKYSDSEADCVASKTTLNIFKYYTNGPYGKKFIIDKNIIQKCNYNNFKLKLNRDKFLNNYISFSKSKKLNSFNDLENKLKLSILVFLDHEKYKFKINKEKPYNKIFRTRNFVGKYTGYEKISNVDFFIIKNYM